MRCFGVFVIKILSLVFSSNLLHKLWLDFDYAKASQYRSFFVSLILKSLMFTGIVQTTATLVSIEEKESFKTFVFSVAAENLAHLTLGASIAINGVCLTVTRFEVSNNDVVGSVYFDVIDETLRVTNLALLKQRDMVNFERSVTFGTEIGGHIVSGHVHAFAEIKQICSTENNCSMKLVLPKKHMKYVLAKGFVCVDGASLTVGEVFEDGFFIHLIPETLHVTNIGQRKEGDKVNIELDQQTYTIVKTVERLMAQKEPVVTY